jgi:MFS family permease
MKFFGHISSTSSESTAQGPGPRGANYRWYVVGMLWWISFFNYADRQAIFSVFSLLETEMKLTEEDKGLLASSFAWVYGLSAPFAGRIVDVVRRKTAILGGLQIWSIICMATALSRKLRYLLFFRAAEGLGETFYYPASVSLISDYHGPRTRSRALGFHQTSVYVGTIGGGFFAGLIGQHFGWRWSFIVFGALGVVLGLVLQRFLHEPERGAAEHTETSAPEPIGPAKRMATGEVLRLLWKSPAVLLLMLAFCCANFVAMVLLSWMPDYLFKKFEISLAMAGLTATFFPQVASMIGSALGGWFADLWRRRSPAGRILVQTVGVMAGAPFVFLTGQTESVLAIIGTLTAWGLFKGLYDANIFASVFDMVPPESRGTTAGLMNMAGWVIGGASAGVVIPLIANHHGKGWAISSAAVVYIAAGILLTAAAMMRAQSFRLSR